MGLITVQRDCAACDALFGVWTALDRLSYRRD